MEELFKLAKEKGYDGPDSLHLQEWFRRKHNLHPEIFFSKFTKKWAVNSFFINLKKAKTVKWDYTSEAFFDYDDALLLALKGMIKLI